MKYLLSLFLIFVFCGCSTLSQSFDDKNIMKIKQGMKSEEILKMFGNPKKVSQAVCGKGDGSWTCTRWDYGSPYVGEQDASFTFSGEAGSYILNNFKVDNGCSSLQGSFSTENIMKIKQGMKSEEILKMFGTPKSASQAVCGVSTGKPWTCTTWSYCNFTDDKASFTFSGEAGSYILNNFNVDR